MASYPSIHDYASALRFIEGGRNRTHRTFPGVRATTARVSWPGKDENELVVIDPVTKQDNTTVVIRQHNTDIITYYQDGHVRLNSGGWRTVTTKDRMNHLTRARIYQEKGIWYIQTKPGLGWEHWKANRALFEDGMLIDAEGKPVLPVTDLALAAAERRKDTLDKAISSYIKGYVAWCEEHKSFPTPGPGDCLYCHLAACQSIGQTQTVQTGTGRMEGGRLVVEDTTGKPDQFPIDHLLSHLGLAPDAPEEVYIPLPSLAWMAFQGRHGNPAFVWGLQTSDFEKGRNIAWHQTWLARNLRAYFRTRTTKLLAQMQEWEEQAAELSQAENGEV